MRKYAVTLRDAIEYGDRRQSVRSPWVVKIQGRCLSPLEVQDGPPIILLGITENISRRGVGLLSDRFVPAYAVLRCELLIVGTDVHVATLARVRWSQQVAANKRYRLGLEFLL